MDGIGLGVFASRLEAVCDEMGATLRRAAFSPNIKDRLDYSCAVFDPQGELCAQAAHIPVHLGSMAYAMRAIVGREQWQPGDMLVLNDPFLGGTHLPDVTVIAPVFAGSVLAGFVANRAHHANIGSDTPGSMPLARELAEEGVLIRPDWLVRQGRIRWDWLHELFGGVDDLLAGDFAAQVSANHAGIRALSAILHDTGVAGFVDHLAGLQAYAARLAAARWQAIPAGDFTFRDVMDDDGHGSGPVTLQCCLRIRGGRIVADFAGTAAQVAGNINCPLPVTAAGVLYALRCLLPDHAPACHGLFSGIDLQVPIGSLLNARPPAAVAAGNVETSSRVVDVVLGALAQALPDLIPAASQGSMNNLAMGARQGQPWDYYETLGGGGGASRAGPGLSAVQTHMTNTLNTPVEVIERQYPLRVIRYAVRRGSGGAGRHRGGDGLEREYEFLAPAVASLLTERRSVAPWGLAGGQPGACGTNRLNGQTLPAKGVFTMLAGDRLCVATPGGGGWGKPE